MMKLSSYLTTPMKPIHINHPFAERLQDYTAAYMYAELRWLGVPALSAWRVVRADRLARQAVMAEFLGRED